MAASRIQGLLDLLGTDYPYASGGRGYGNIPPGDYPVGSYYAPGTRPSGFALPSFALPSAIPDPRMGSVQGGNRLGILIHPSSSQSDIDKILSSGCVAIAKDQWPAFKQALLDAQQQYGSLVLSVDANGQASIHPPGSFAGQIVSPNTLIASNVIGKGMNNDPQRVAALQQTLAQNGYYTGPIDGIYGSGTEAATAAAQRALGVSADGKWGPVTARAATVSGLVNPADNSLEARTERGAQLPVTMVADSDATLPRVGTAQDAAATMAGAQPAPAAPLAYTDSTGKIVVPPGPLGADKVVRAAMAGDANGIHQAFTDLFSSPDIYKQGAAVTDYFANLKTTMPVVASSVATVMANHPALWNEVPATFWGVPVRQPIQAALTNVPPAHSAASWYSPITPKPAAPAPASPAPTQSPANVPSSNDYGTYMRDLSAAATPAPVSRPATAVAPLPTVKVAPVANGPLQAASSPYSGQVYDPLTGQYRDPVSASAMRPDATASILKPLAPPRTIAAPPPVRAAVQMPIASATIPDRLTSAISNGLGALSQSRPQQNQSQYLSSFSPAIQSAVNSGTPYTPTGSPGSQGNGIVSGANGTFQVNYSNGVPTSYTSLSNGRTFPLS